MSSTRLVRALYRLLHRQARTMRDEIPFQESMDLDAWLVHGGSPKFGPLSDPAKLLQERLPWLGDLEHGGMLNRHAVSSAANNHFRRAIEENETIEERIDRAFDAIRVLEEQKFLARMSSSTETRGVVVDVTTGYVGTQKELDPMYDDSDEYSDPLKYFYTYRIRVSNHGSKPVQLVSRHWKVYGKNGDLQMEVAPGARGVVGQTPIIKPNTSFSYYSGTDIDSKGGSMEGSFGMAVVASGNNNDKEEEFDAMISRFPFQD